MSLAALATLFLLPAPHQPHRPAYCTKRGNDVRAAGDNQEELSVRELVMRDRLFRRTGVLVGGGLIAACIGAGIQLGMFDPKDFTPILCGLAGVVGSTKTYEYLAAEERGAPLDKSAFRIGPSPGCGQGLFAERSIPAGTFLFDYEGERLDEDAFFMRYPKGDGRYIACITDNLYIDGQSVEASNEARWMNHARGSAVNVIWRKQQLGPRLAMHFYTTRAVEEGEELRFDYGDEYWAALRETPLEQ